VKSRAVRLRTYSTLKKAIACLNWPTVPNACSSSSRHTSNADCYILYFELALEGRCTYADVPATFDLIAEAVSAGKAGNVGAGQNFVRASSLAGELGFEPRFSESESMAQP
jgi:hypothetical protein